MGSFMAVGTKQRMKETSHHFEFCSVVLTAAKDSPSVAAADYGVNVFVWISCQEGGGSWLLPPHWSI